MSSDDGARVKALLADFSQSLSSLLAEEGLLPSHALRTGLMRVRSIRGVDLELIELSNMVENVLKSLDRADTHSDPPVDMSDSEDAIQEMSQYVIVCGPPGTESIPNLSDARFDDLESIVYSRTSLGVRHLAGRAPNYKQVLSIPPKDTPPIRAEVYACSRPMWVRAAGQSMERSHSSVLSTPPMSPPSSTSSSSSSSSSTEISYNISPASVPKRQGLRNHRKPPHISLDNDSLVSSTMSHESPSLISTNPFTHHDSTKHKEEDTDMEEMILDRDKEAPAPVIKSDVFMGIELESRLSDDDDAYHTAQEADTTKNDFKTALWSPPCNDTDSLFIGQASTDESDVQQQQRSGSAEEVSEMISERESSPASRSSNLESAGSSSLSRVYSDMKRDFQVNRKPLKKETTSLKKSSHKKQKKIIRLPRNDSVSDTTKTVPEEEEKAASDVVKDKKVLKSCHVVLKRLDFFNQQRSGSSNKDEKDRSPPPSPPPPPAPAGIKSPKMVLTRHHGNNRTSLRHKATTKVETEPVGDKLGEKDAEAAEKSPSSSTESITFSDVANDVMRDPLSQSEHHTPDRSPVPEDRISRSCGPLNRLKKEKKGRGISDAIPPIHSSDSDFESPVSCQLSLRRKKYSTDPTLLKKKRKRIENCSSGDEERPFAEKSSKKKLCFNTDSGVCDETEETHVAKIGTEESPAVKIGANRSPSISENLDDDVDDNFGIEADDSPNEIGIDSPESNDHPANNGSGSLTIKSPTLETGASENLTEAGVVSSEEQEPFTLTSEKAGLKLGKHIKGPHCKGKEKARGPPPRIVKCVACGTNVDWKKQKIHGHPRLDVITCQKCFKMYNTGEFQIWDSNEIFCSLCGDGGDILLCNYCDKSFCNACVGRISGKERLKHLLEEENEIFQCYICEPAPLKTEQELYIQLKGYFRGMGNVRSKRLQKSQKYVIDSDEDGALGRGVMDADGDSENGECSNKDDSRVPEKSDKQEASSIHGRTERKRGGRRRGNASSLGPSDDDSSSSEGNSPDIGSGELSLSDSDVLEKMEAKKKNLRKKSSRGGSKNKGSSIKKEEEEEEGQKRKKERRMRANHGYNTMSHSSDEEDQGSGEGTSAGSEGGGKRSSKKRILSSTNSESAADSGGRVKRNPRQKKSRLAASLSSNSEEEQSPQKVLLFGADMRGMGDSDDDEPPARCTSTEGSDSGPVQYKMFDAPSSDGSSSDFEFSIRRKPKNKKSEQKKSFLSSSNENKSSSSETTSKRTYKTRSRRKRDELSSDDNFVPAVQLSKKGPKTRRKNINYSLLTSDSEDESGGEAGSDGEEKEALTASQEVEKGKKRRKIRKMIGDAKLASETKMAIQKEKEREERLKKRKNLMEDEDDRLVLEQDSETKEVVLEVRRDLVPSIKPHQRDGIKFLYNACVENVKRLSSGGGGGGGGTGAILAHCMGLGKTLQVIAFADALMTCKKTGIKKVLILCPVNTVFNWKIEFLKWIPYRDCEYNIYLLNETTAKARVGKIKRWFTNGGIMFMGYEMFRNLSISKRAKKKMKEELKKYLLDPGADLVVCDEGHVMRNSKSSLSLVINQVKTRLRIVLTGTPLQNNLTEYYTMVNFVKPNLLGMPKEFKNRFVNPITNGQCRDSSPFDIRTMKQRAHVLCTLLKGTVQRRDFRVLSKSLPPKKEFVLNIRLSSVQDHLYRKYLDTGRGYRCASDLFSTFAALAKVWNHPWVLKLDEQRKFEKEERVAMYGLSSTDDETLGGFIVSGSEDEVEERKGKITRKEHIKRNLRGVSATSSSASGFSQPVTPFNANPTDGPIIISSDEELLPHINIKPEPNRTPGVQKKEEEGDPKRGVAENTSVHWYDNLLPDSCEEVLELSGKLLFLFKLLEQTKQLKEKVLVFSQNLLTLDLIEEFLSKPKYGDWIPALDYYRLDGSTSAEIRTANMTEFNKSGNDRLRLFLISTRAGSLGVNLVAANRVVIFDACWNPSHDLQALFRAYRYGQEKPVFVYRLLAQGTMEEKIYDRQVTKQSLSMRVVDEKQIGRHYSSSDLAELFTYTPPSPPPPPGANLAKPYERPDEDLVLCEILNELQPDWVTSYHEHDSLLEHIDDEELSEEERKAAMDQYKQQMAIESAKYNMEALQNRLDISAPEGSSGGAAANITIPPSAVPPGISKVKTVRDLTDQAIIHVRQIKFRDSRLREMKRQYTNSPMIPRQISNDITSLEAGLKQGYALLADTIKRVNVALEDFVKSPLSSHQPFMIEVNKKRQMLYNDLESLNVTRANYAPYAQPRSQPHPLPAQPHPLSVSSQLHQNSPPLFKSAEEVSSTTR